MNSRKASISHVMNDSSVVASSSDHHLSSNSGHSLRNLLSDDGPAQQHASSQQQYHHSAGNNSGLSNGTYGAYPNEQGRDYYSHVQQQQPQQPVHNQPLSSHEQNNRPSFLNNDVSADADEASKTLILLSQRAPSSHYGSSRDHYSSKDNTQQISDVEIAASAISSLSHSPDDTKSIHPQTNQRTRTKNNFMAISSLISGDESTSSDPIQSMQAAPTSTVNFNSYNANNNGNGRKSAKRPLNGSPSLPIAKGFSKKSPQKRRPSDPNENSQRKIHRSPDHMPYPSGGQKYSDLREHPVEEQKPPIHLVPVSQGGPTNSMDWDHQMPPQQQYNQSRSLHNVPPTDHPGRFQPKTSGSPPMPADKSMNIKPHYAMNPNERTLAKTSPIHPSNGYVPGVGVDGIVGNPPITQSIPQQNGQIRPQSSNPNFCRMYNDMQKHNTKKKRNASHAYISYMIYTKSLQDVSENGRINKEYNLPPNNNMINRPVMPESSPPMNNEHMVNPSIVHHHHPPPVNGSIYPPRVDHPGYPLQPSNPGYIHPEANPQSVQPRRVSDSPMHPQPNSNPISLSRGYSHHGPPVPEPQPPHTSHRHSIGSHHTSPSLLPTHIQSQNHSIRHNPSMPNLHSDPQHRTPPSPLSRSGSVPRQPPTTLPPLQSQPSYMSQPPPTQGPSPHIYNGKSSPVPPSLIPPQSPAMNHYHSSQPGLVSQNGSRLPPVGSHHHSSQPPEPVGPSNNSPHQIISQPLTNFLRDQPNAYGSAHPHNIQPNGLSPVGPPSHVGPLNSGPRSASGYY
ncbi:28886_t:CDS:10 [Dentiscutata erythropus]|uniref:28886_t:CDS:1 n=1 Tax=Dentiscutata erythropus TaxID=1348616 RepID=A0A9N8ZR87_9GLOM|nr:28886_t:CDS:10 [Dentiscutata erythropus]